MLDALRAWEMDMARFRDEAAGDSPDENWERIAELVASGKTVEVYGRSEGGDVRLKLRVWTGKRTDGSNRVNADQDQDY